MKNIIQILISFPVAVNVANGQKVREERMINTSVAEKEPFLAEAKIKKKEKAPVLHYSHVIIKDKRQDDTKMGYVRLELNGKLHKIVFPKEGEEYLNLLFNDAIQPLQDFDTLVIVLNELWFNETRTRTGWLHKQLLGAQELVSSCYLNADFFIKRDNGFIPVGSFDSVAIKKGEWLPNNCGKILEKAIINLLVSGDNLCNEIKSSTRVIPPPEFEKILQNRFNYPILKADKPAKGIYFTYDDFLNNTPVPIEFMVISEVRNRISYPNMGKEDKSWGYCDGENIYMHIDKGFYKLNRNSNTYEVVGPATVEFTNTFMDQTLMLAANYFTPPSGFLDATVYADLGVHRTEYYKYYRLNMQSGVLY